MIPLTHKTGYLYQSDGGSFFYESTEVFFGPMESWHRTLNGACAAKRKNKGRGTVYRLEGDSSRMVF